MNISLRGEAANAPYEGVPCSYVLSAVDGKILWVNSTFVQVVGLAKGIQLKMKFHELLAPASKVLYETQYQPHRRMKGAIRDLTLEFTRPNGESIPMVVKTVREDDSISDFAHVNTVFMGVTERADNEEDLSEAGDIPGKLADVIRVCDTAILTTTVELSVKTWNPAASALFGEELITGIHLVGLLPFPSIRLLSDAVRDAAPRTFEIATSRGRLCQVKAYRISDGLSIFLSDITKERAKELELERAHERFRLATMSTTDGIWDFDCAGGLVYYSARWRSILGLPDEEFTGTMDVWRERLHSADVPRARDVWNELYHGTKSDLEVELRHRHEDGTWRWILCRAMCQREPNGALLRLTGSISDITARKIVDPLTNLHNRLSLLEQLQWRIERDHHHDRCYALLFIDLDLFKRINDSLGHLGGDALLVEVGLRLEETVKLVPGSLVSRLGGDEFIVLLGDVAHEEDALTYASMLQYLLGAPIDCRGQQVCISASIGVAVGHPGTYTKAEQVLEDADVAMYAAKANGKAQSATFTQEMRASATSRLADEAALRIALSEQQFELFYQPSVDLSAGTILGFEALIRWHHPSRGLVGPDGFIPLAEETGLISQIGRWALERAIGQFAEWRQNDLVLPTATIAVNLSAKQLNEPHLIEDIDRFLEAAMLPPECLVLEVTESMLMHDTEGVVGVLHRLGNRGVGLYMDDFGTGYSSLSHLHRFPFHCLKIDRSFIERMDDDPKSIKLVSAIISLGISLGMCVIAEGVETESQRTNLLRMGCLQAQGFLFLEASPAGSIERLLCASASRAPFPPYPFDVQVADTI